MRRFALLFTSLILAVGALALTSPASNAKDLDCSDFDTQGQAQNYYNNHPADLDGLDGSDNDGRACESLPCPCATGGGGGNNGGDSGTGGHKNPTLRQAAKVIRVIDGDTVKVKLAGGPKRDVRLIGIDTPEVYGGVECGGKKASSATKRWLPRGTRVKLVSDSSQDLKDRYGRLLRYVMKGKTDINRKLVAKGHARVYVYNRNPFKRVGAYRSAQSQANTHDLGLWGDC